MYEVLKETFRSVFGIDAALLFSAPGRTELCGNHTDHQGGMVLAAAVHLETAAAVRPREDSCIRLLSEGYPMCMVQLDSPEPRKEETGTTAALIRGVAAGFLKRGFSPRGFDACVCSNVLTGSGLSSSAAFEASSATVSAFSAAASASSATASLTSSASSTTAAFFILFGFDFLASCFSASDTSS